MLRDYVLPYPSLIWIGFSPKWPIDFLLKNTFIIYLTVFCTYLLNPPANSYVSCYSKYLSYSQNNAQAYDIISHRIRVYHLH